MYILLVATQKLEGARKGGGKKSIAIYSKHVS